MKAHPLSYRRKAERSLGRVLGHLRDLIEDSDLSHAQVESQAGFSRGYLTQLLNRRIDLKVSHLMAVLGAISVTPSRFFGELFPAGGRPRPYLPRCTDPALMADLGPQQDVVRLYGFGIDSVQGLRRRLECCESDLSELIRGGLLDRPASGDADESS